MGKAWHPLAQHGSRPWAWWAWHRWARLSSAQRGLAQPGRASLSTAWQGLIWCHAQGQGLARLGLAWHHQAWPGTVWLSPAQLSLVKLGMGWFGSAQPSMEKPKLGTAQLVARLGTGGMLLLSFLPADAGRPRGEDFPAHFPPPVPVLTLHRASSSPGPFSSLAGSRARGGARTGLGTRGWGHREAQTVDGLRVLCILCSSSGCSCG